MLLLNKESVYCKLNITKTDILDDNMAFVLHNVLSKKECDQIIEYGEKEGFKSLASEYSPNYRKSERINVDDNEFGDILLKRVKPFLTEKVKLTKQTKTHYIYDKICGTWKLDKINPWFRLCKYEPGGFFKKHLDSGYHPKVHSHRSLITIMVYLNDDYQNGETIIYDINNNENDKEIFRLKAKPGDCLIFNQKILHEGNEVNNGIKYMIRSDIFYTLEHSDYDEEKEDPIKVRAKDYYRIASIAEAEKDFEKAIEYYIKAERLWVGITNLDLETI